MKTARLPTSEPAKRVAAIFHRQLTTKWSLKEIAKFRSLVKDGCFDSLNNLALVERCYAMQWPPNRDKNILRHDLITFLNHYEGEVDKAVAYDALHPVVKVRKIIPLPLAQVSHPPLVEDDPEATARFLAEFAARKGRPLSKP